MNTIFESIKKRYSVRTYDKRPIEKEKLEVLKHYLTSNKEGPFGNSVRFELIDIGEDADKEIKNYISYGNIKGSRLFIAGSVTKGNKSMEDFGYCMEKNILMATSLGLGTVWLAGSPKRSTFVEKMGTSNDEVIPAITPLGYAANKRSLMDKALRTFSGGNNRKNFRKLFFDGDLSSPLNQSTCGEYADVLEAVRLGPSASNKQPWRIIKEKNKNIFHFYMDEHPSNRAMKDISIQNNDLGIAMCHFELTARELGLEGSWYIEKPALMADNLVYIVSWN